MNVVLTDGFGEYVGEGGEIGVPRHLAHVFDLKDSDHGMVVPPGYLVTSMKRQSRPIVYVAGPISHGDLAANVNAGTLAAMHLIACGFAPICPHWSVFSAFPAQPVTGGCLALGTPAGFAPYEDVLDADFELVDTCEALIRLPGESPGSDREVARAKARGTPVYGSVEEMCGPFRWRQTFTLATRPGETFEVRAYRRIDLVHAVRHELLRVGGAGLTPDVAPPTRIEDVS